ncbi:MAG TPA: GntR family transcriptional regulator [Candidatus Limnocylindrales bacterium]|nr:GntR family transcriptional regulator [Candidatus Limnocylindrales bacterium]
MILGSGTNRAEKRFKSLTKLLTEKLKEAIVTGKISPGERLAETELAVSLKVGPVALREALRALEAEGYVTFRPDNDVIVSKPSREEIEDCYSIGAVLEGLAARLAVDRAKPEEVERLKELHLALKETSQKRDLVRYFDANLSFHRFIAEIARNERLYRLIDQLRQEFQKTRILTQRLERRLDQSMREHDQIMDAFLKRNSALAETTMVRHLNNQMESLRKAIDGSKGENR